MAKIYEGYFLIADITGYTRYLSESELEHAQDTLTALLELFFYYGQTFIEKIEDSYVDFRKTLERLVLNNTCRCNACANISNLDLKFFVHYGTFGIQRISDHDELVGSDVILLHRLLKNSVVEKTGFSGYALYTEAATKKLAIADIAGAMIPLVESYEHLGDVSIWVQDMHQVWEDKRHSVVEDFPADRVAMQFEIDIDLPAEIVWDYLIQPEFRNILFGADRMEIANRSQGRIAPGSVYQCYHGDKLIPRTILEWQPFERILVKELFPYASGVSFLSEYRLASAGGKTRFYRTLGMPTGPILGRTMLRIMAPMFKGVTRRATEAFGQQIVSDYRAQSEPAGSQVGFTNEQIREEAAAGLRE